MDRKGGALIHLPEGLLHAILEILRKIYKKLGKRDQIKLHQISKLGHYLEQSNLQTTHG